MEFIKAGKVAYAYTVKYLKNKTEEATAYERFFDKLSKFGIKVEYKVAERDRHGKLHYHGIIYIEKGFFRRRLITENISLKLEEIYDRSGWIKYISKDLEHRHLELQASEEGYNTDDSVMSVSDEPRPIYTRSLFK